jgi:hypothetical protein
MTGLKEEIKTQNKLEEGYNKLETKISKGFSPRFALGAPHTHCVNSTRFVSINE